MDSADRIAQIVADHDITPVAVLLTHGHVDHAASAALVADRYGARCWVGAGDLGQLSDPLSGLPDELHPMLAELLAAEGGPEQQRSRALPATMLQLPPGPVRLAGLDFTLLPAPGHTPGSTLIALAFRAEDDDDDGDDAGDDTGGSEQVRTVVFTGDVVFAGTIGRTDLPGGDHPTMLRTLDEVVLSLPEDAILLPGHGAQTTLARERVSNPYLVSRSPGDGE